MIAWVLGHWHEIGAALVALLAAASAITRLTPSPKDDAAVAAIRRLVGRLSALQPRDSGRLAKLPGARPAPPPHPDDHLPR